MYHSFSKVINDRSIIYPRRNLFFLSFPNILLILSLVLKRSHLTILCSLYFIVIPNGSFSNPYSEHSGHSLLYKMKLSNLSLISGLDGWRIHARHDRSGVNRLALREEVRSLEGRGKIVFRMFKIFI